MTIDRKTHTRRLRPAVLAGAVAAVALGAGLAAPGGAGAALRYSHHHGADGPNPPTTVNGVLSITGTRGDDRIALRLQKGQPNLLQVDFGNDGSAEFTVDQDRRHEHRRRRRRRSDSVSVDESNGAVRERADDDRRRRRRRQDRRRLRQRDPDRRQWGRHDRRQPRRRHRIHERWRRHVHLGPGRRQRRCRGAGRPRHDALQRRARHRAHRPVRERRPPAVLPRRRQDHDGHRTASNASTSSPSEVATRSP